MNINFPKLTSEQQKKKEERRREFMTVFVNGKQKRVKRPDTIDGQSVDEFIRANADPIWLHKNEMWECIVSSQEGEAKDESDEFFDKQKALFES